jgi:dihydroneopterin aldolase
MNRDKIIIQDLHLQVVIGAHKPERTIEQNLHFTITLFTGIKRRKNEMDRNIESRIDTEDISKCGETDNVADTIDYVHVTKAVTTYAKEAHHFTIEALAVGVARICCLGFGVEEVTVR